MSTTDDGRNDPNAGILADLESLRASRRPADQEHAEDAAHAGSRSLLDDIAEAAGHLREGNADLRAPEQEIAEEKPADEKAAGEKSAPEAERRSARSAVANRGLVFESYIADTADQEENGASADETADEEADEEEESSAPAVNARNPFSHSSGGSASGFSSFTAPAGGGLLFQPPQEDLAQPVDSDWFDDDDDENDEDSVDSRTESDTGASPDSDDDSGEFDDDDRGRSRRRRGGRGRRSRGRGRDDDRATDGDTGDDRNAAVQQGGAEESGERGSRRRRTSSGGSDGGDRSADASENRAEDRSGSSQGGGDGRNADAQHSTVQDSTTQQSTVQDSTAQDRAGKDSGAANSADGGEQDSDDDGSRRRRRRRARGSKREGGSSDGEVTGLKGSTRMEAKRQRRREGREAGRRRPLLTEAEFLARRESVARTMLVREQAGRTQLAVLEDGIAVEHYLSEHKAQASLIGNVYLGKVQNVLPSMEAAFIDIGKGRNAVLYAGEVNWDALGMNGKPHRIEQALSPGDPVLVQVTKDPVGHKGARLTSQISLPGRFLVFIPGNSMTGISRKLPDNERARLKKLLKEILPEQAGVIVRTASEGAADEELRQDVERLSKRWDSIVKKSAPQKSDGQKPQAPKLLYSEPDMIVRIIRDVFNEDFESLVIDGDAAWDTIHEYVEAVAPDLLDRVSRYGAKGSDTAQAGSEGIDIFDHFRVSEQIEKALNRKVNLPSGGSLVLDRTEAMTVIDVNTGKFTGSGGNLEETVTKNNLEAAEEVIRQLRLRDIGGIIVVDFIDMVLEANRDLVTRRLVECLARDRTRHQVAEVTSLGLVQMTRKRIGTGLAESFDAAGEDLSGRGLLLPGTESSGDSQSGGGRNDRSERRSKKKNRGQSGDGQNSENRDGDQEKSEQSRSAVAAIAKATLKQGESKDTDAQADPAAESTAASEAEAEAAGKTAGRQKDERSSDGSRPASAAGAPGADGSEDQGPESGGGRKRSRNRRSRSRGDGQQSGGGEDSNVQSTSSRSADSQDTQSRQGEDRGGAQSGAAEARQQAAPALPEPSGPAPLMIGADTTTSVQKAPRRAEPAPAVRQDSTAVEKAADEKAAADTSSAEKTERSAPKAPAAPILIIGMDD